MSSFVHKSRPEFTQKLFHQWLLLPVAHPHEDPRGYKFYPLQFRPCIDVHKGKVKQIVGTILSDLKGRWFGCLTNFESDKSPEEYVKMYKDDGLTVGHVIKLGADPLSQAAALGELHAYAGTL